MAFETRQQQQAYADGFRSGRADRVLGYRSTYASYVERTGSGYALWYSLGYNAAWRA